MKWLELHIDTTPAGLEPVSDMLRDLGIEGLVIEDEGDFREIDVEDLTKHKMDSEQMVVNADVVEVVNTAKDNGRQICAVGTSVMRAIETAVSTDGHLKEFEGWTNKFIFPPYDFSVASSMITNFHMPLSTLLMMTASFGGYEQIMDAYEVALKEKYSFGAYGDAMLIL